MRWKHPEGKHFTHECEGGIYARVILWYMSTDLTHAFGAVDFVVGSVLFLLVPCFIWMFNVRAIQDRVAVIATAPLTTSEVRESEHTGAGGVGEGMSLRACNVPVAALASHKRDDRVNTPLNSTHACSLGSKQRRTMRYCCLRGRKWAIVLLGLQYYAHDLDRVTGGTDSWLHFCVPVT